jgi:transposase-like protein
MDQDNEVQEEQGVAPLDASVSEPLPACPFCGGEVDFLGNESPDGHWVIDWKRWFKCKGCGKQFSQKTGAPLRLLYSYKK